jgi:hypothetical protein
MFGSAFADCWYEIPGLPGLELSGDLRFRGPRGIRRLRHDAKGRPYVQAVRPSGKAKNRRLRDRRVMLHRAVMSISLGRALTPSEFVCHRDDDKRNNWPDNLYLGDRKSNAADSLRNGRQPTGNRHPCTKLSDEQVRQVRLALARGEKGIDLARRYGVHKSLISRINSGVRRSFAT